jgi:hypothetical protein
VGNVDVAGRRRQMGQALGGWSSVPGAVHAVGDGSWMYLSGLPSADLNMALVHGSDPGDLKNVVDRIDEMDALRSCSAPATGWHLPRSWVMAGRTSERCRS